jgi:glycosyltransferase involved in cell wall biosynthesis
MQRGRDTSKKVKCLLLVGMLNSPHFQKWILGIQASGTVEKVIIFPSDRYSKIPDFYHHIEQDLKIKVVRSFLPLKLFYFVSFAMDYFLGSYWRSLHLLGVARLHSPEIIHFHETQHGAYLFNPIESKLRSAKIKKIVSTWGSDLTIYSKIGKNLSQKGLVNQNHENEISKVLSWADVVTAERFSEHLDLERFNFTGTFLAPVYITVGTTANELATVTQPPSARSQIIIKGYQHDAGRALNALEAIRRAKDELKQYEVVLYSASEAVRIQAELVAFETGVKFRILPRAPHSEVLQEFCKSRIYIGLSISDGLSTSMVEAMSMGCFPIQSQNSAAGEFLEDGISGFIVDPWDIDGLVTKLSTALRDDDLVNEASRRNIEMLKKKYSLDVGIKMIQELYLSNKS